MDDERNNFDFSVHRKHRSPRETSEIQSGKPRSKTPERQRSFPTANPITRN